MTEEQFTAEKHYHLAIYMMKTLNKQGIIDDEEFGKIQEDLIGEYQPVISSLIVELGSS